jgi:transposase
MHDHWKPYYTLKGVLHALCNAHHLRELKALVEIEREDWARKMQTLLRRTCHATNLAREQGVQLPPVSSRWFNGATTRSWCKASRSMKRSPRWSVRPARQRPPRTHARRVGHNLLLRLSTANTMCSASRPTPRSHSPTTSPSATRG